MVIDKRNTRSNDVQNILPRKVRQKCVIGQVGKIPRHMAKRFERYPRQIKEWFLMRQKGKGFVLIMDP